MASKEAAEGTEIDRIRAEYARRQQEIPADFYSVIRPANLFLSQQRCRALLAMLKRAGLLPLASRRVLEVGCGRGQWLVDFETWGAERKNLAGIDLCEDRVAAARRRLCAWRDQTGSVLSQGADIRVGDAGKLPWDDAGFDLVLQATVFSSILDAEVRSAVAGEMIRVLRPGGAILWYDFFYDNPGNPNVRGVRKPEIRRLFEGFDICLRRVTLAPPLARRVVPVSWIGATVLESLRLLNTHYLGLFRKSCR